MLAALTAVLLAAALTLEAAGRQVVLGRWLALAGVVFLVAAVFAPYRPHSPPGRRVLSEHPHFGKTRSGLHVHLRTVDHLPHGNAVSRFNARVAVLVTKTVGSMWCAYAFAAFDLISLPDAIKAGTPAIVSWIAQTFLQLVLLSVIMVGQDVQARASDARAAKTFEDAESAKADLAVALDRLDVTTEGGIKAILDAVNALGGQPAMEQLVHVHADPLSDAQVKQLVAAIQASVMKQASKNRGMT